MGQLQRPQDWRGDTEGNKGHFIAWQTLVPHKAAQLPLVKRSSQGRTPEPGEAASTVSSAGCTGQVGAVGSRGQHGSWTAGLVRCRARLSCITGHSRTAAGQGACSMGLEAGSYLLSASSGVPNILALIFLLCFLTATFMASSRSPGTRWSVSISRWKYANSSLSKNTLALSSFRS